MTNQKEVGNISNNNGRGNQKTTMGVNILIQQNNESKCHCSTQATICHDKLVNIIQLDDMQVVSISTQQQDACIISVMRHDVFQISLL